VVARGQEPGELGGAQLGGPSRKTLIPHLLEAGDEGLLFGMGRAIAIVLLAGARGG
jgi:hypothetical protein